MRYKSVRIEFSGVGHDDFLGFVGFFSDIPNGSDVRFVSNASHESLTESDT